MLDTLSHTDFEPLVSQAFVVVHAHGALGLELVEVSVMDERHSDPRRRLAFSLVFHGPAEPTLAQGTYTLRNATLGELAVFMVPLGPVDAGLRYEVVFT